MTKRTLFFSLIFLFLLAGTVQAALEDRGYGSIVNGAIGGDYRLIYDTVLDITWLDFSHTQSSGTWLNQSNWAADLEVEYDNQVFDNWRLPQIDGSIPVGTGQGYSGPYQDANGDEAYSYLTGYNMYNSELGHLFYQTLDNSGLYDINGNANSPYGLQNSGIFAQLLNTRYWLGIEQNGSEAWVFGTNYGKQEIVGKGTELYGIAVLPGDINAVPLPAAFWLLGSGLLALMGIRKKRK